MSSRLAAAFDKLRSANANLNKIVQADYPVGSTIHYSFCGHLLTGVVELVGWPTPGDGPRIKVRSATSGKSYWITAAHIVTNV